MMADGDGRRQDSVEAEQLRTIERERLRALVAADMAVARPLHADDFQLITPTGRPFSKEQYLGAITSGVIRYLKWEPEERSPCACTARSPSCATRRTSKWATRTNQRSSIAGISTPMNKRDGRWQVVWSQATEIR